MIPLLLSLMSIPHNDSYPPPAIAADARREKTLVALNQWIAALGAVRPLVLLLEDAHWCDPSSLALFRGLVANRREARVLIPMTARPEFAPV